jgi:hypothetical protein
MPEPPEIRVVRGDPTPEEEEAIREAILRVWRNEQTEARRASGRTPWVEAARAEGIGADASDIRGADAWRASIRPSNR